MGPLYMAFQIHEFHWGVLHPGKEWNYFGPLLNLTGDIGPNFNLQLHQVVILMDTSWLWMLSCFKHLLSGAPGWSIKTSISLKSLMT